jgi:hypothetical protein
VSDDVSRPRPDPWAVVERLAARAATATVANESGITDDRSRLVLYARMAPDVIGARQLGPEQRGAFTLWLDQLRGRAKWWGVQLPGTRRWLAWDEQGDLWLSPGPRGGSQIAAVAGALSLAFATALFARVMGPRAIIPAAFVAFAAAMIAKQVGGAWQKVELEGADPKVKALVAELVERYEQES